MSTVKTRAHYKALTELVELMAVASLIALFADCLWVIRDMYVGGVTSGLFIVAILLHAAFTGMLYGVYKYHYNQVRVILHEMLEIKSRYAKRNRKQSS